MKKIEHILLLLLLLIASAFVGACSNESVTSSEPEFIERIAVSDVNSEQFESLDSFEVARTVYLCDSVLAICFLKVEGRCFVSDIAIYETSVFCKIGDNKYKEHSLTLRNPIIHFIEPLDTSGLDKYPYSISKPKEYPKLE